MPKYKLRAIYTTKRMYINNIFGTSKLKIFTVTPGFRCKVGMGVLLSFELTLHFTVIFHSINKRPFFSTSANYLSAK